MISQVPNITKVPNLTPFCWFCNKEVAGVFTSSIETLGSAECNDCHIHYFWEYIDDKKEWAMTVMNFNIKPNVVFYVQFETKYDDYFQKASAGINFLVPKFNYKPFLSFTDIEKYLSMPLQKLKDKLKLLLVFS